MSSATEKQLHTYIRTEILMDEQVIQRVDELSTKEKHPDMTKGSPIFEWSPGIPSMDQE